MNSSEMDGDSLTTIGRTEYEDILGESADDMTEHSANFTALEAVWGGGGGGGGVGWLHLHELAALLLSSLVVLAHGLLGLLPRSLLAALRTALTAVLVPWCSAETLATLGAMVWHGLHWALTATLTLACVYALVALAHTVHKIVLWLLARGLNGTDGKDSEEPSEEDDVRGVESIVSAQLEKEKRVQRWIDNLCSNREQVNLEACGEMQGRNMEADLSGADLLGDGQPLEAPPPARASDPRPLPAPPAVEPRPLSKEARKALSLAYELSLAVRKQTENNLRASLSLPDGAHHGGVDNGATREDWMLVRRSPRGKQALETPIGVKVQPGAPSEPSLAKASPSTPLLPTVGQRAALPAPALPPPALPPPALPPPALPPPGLLDGAGCSGAAQTTPSESDALNPSSSLLNFMRRFSGTRFLLKEIANVASESLRPRTLQMERSAVSPSREDAVSSSISMQDKANMMKVFSKGLLSESTVDISNTSIQDSNRHQGALDVAGAQSLQAQGLLRPRTATAATSTSDRDPSTETLARYSSSTVTTSRGLTASMSEEGLPRRDLDEEHKSAFDMRKSLLSSIPEANAPDEDPAHT